MKRRTALGVIGATALSPLIMTAGGVSAALNLDPADPDDTLLIHRKLAYSMDDSLTFWWLRSTRFGLVDSAFRPLWNVHVGHIRTTTDLDDDGAFETTAISIGFYTDLENGQVLETFKNPYTDQEIDVPIFGGATPNKRAYSRDGDIAELPSRDGFKVTSHIPLGPTLIEGDDVWVRHEAGFRMEPETPEAGKLFQINDQSTYHGSLKEVADTDIKNAPATWSFNDLNTWPAWMGMGDHVGNYFSRGFGRKVFTIDDMPSTWHGFVADRFPEVVKDPRGALQG